jgi:hypothetical protein
MYQFLLFSGGLGCRASLFFIAILTEMGTGSTGGLMISGPIILLGFKTLGLIILFMEFDFIGSLILFELF